MINDLRQAVNKLRALAPQLNSAVDEAHNVVQMVERFLAAECQLCVEADIPVNYNDKGKAIMLLRYGPVAGGYRICLTHTDGDSRFMTQPWTDCDRCEKLASFPALPKLLMAVAKAVETQITSTSATVATVSQIMSALAQPIHKGEVHTLPDLAILLQQPTSDPAKPALATTTPAHKANGRVLDRRPIEKNIEPRENGHPGAKQHAGANGTPLEVVGTR